MLGDEVARVELGEAMPHSFGDVLTEPHIRQRPSERWSFAGNVLDLVQHRRSVTGV